jgi:hypothetical protein
MNNDTSYNIYFNLYANSTLQFSVTHAVYASHEKLLNMTRANLVSADTT